MMTRTSLTMALQLGRLLCWLILLIFIKNGLLECLNTRLFSTCDSIDDLYSDKYKLRETVKIEIGKSQKLNSLKLVDGGIARNIKRLEVIGLINNIEKGALKNFVHLKSLILHRNNFTTLKVDFFENLKEIEYLSIIDNKVESIEVGVFDNLKKLDNMIIRGNNIKKIELGVFNNLPELRQLSLGANNIVEIAKTAFNNLPKLRNLYLNSNSLKSFNVQDYLNYTNDYHIQRLWLQNNSLTELTVYMLENLSQLEVLNVGFNSISSIEPESFAQTPSLKVLVLTHNLLKRLDGAILPQNGLIELKTLYLDNNRLMFLPSTFLPRLPALKSMSLGGNPWKCSCVELVLKWVSDRGISLKCDGEFFNGTRPICVVDGGWDSGCSYTFDETLDRYYREKYGDMYKEDKFCLL